MKFNNNKEKVLSIEITPLIDIVFLLVIFFVVTSKIETNQYLTLDLPKSESFASALSNNSQNIILLESGILIINNHYNHNIHNRIVYDQIQNNNTLLSALILLQKG